MLFIIPPIVTDVILRHPQKAYAGIDCVVTGIEIVVFSSSATYKSAPLQNGLDETLSNEHFIQLAMLFKLTIFSFGQFENASVPIFVKLVALISIAASLEQYWKASFPMLVTVLGIVIVVNLGQQRNA